MPKTLNLGVDALIYCSGDKADKIFLIQKGRVLLSYMDIETGKETANIVEPGEFFGIKPVLGRYAREESAFAKNQATLLVFTLSEFEQLLLSNNRVTMKMLKVFSDQLRSVHAHISSITKTQYIKPDYGLFEIGEKYLKRKRYSHAKYIFDRYLELYPEEENSEEARAHLKTLAKTSAKDDRSRFSVGTAPASESAGDDSSLQMDADFLARFSRVFGRGEIIFSEYEPGSIFYLIRSGDVRLLKGAGQDEYTLDVLRQSEMFGEMAILDKSPRTATAIAINEVTLLEFNEENFEILMRGNPHIAIKLLKVFSTRIQRAKRRFMILTLSDPQARVADVFLMLDEIGASADGSAGFYSREFKVNMEEVAHWAGMPLSDTRSVLEFYASQRRVSIYQDRIEVKNINDFSRFVASRRNCG